MSIYVFKEWPQPDNLAQHIEHDCQAEVIIIAKNWSTVNYAITDAGITLLQQWQRAKIFWQQQPVFCYPLTQGKLILIQPEAYAQWRMFNHHIDNVEPISISKSILKPWLKYPTPQPVESVAIIGGGLAGAATAYALAKRGVSVIVIEQNKLAHAASGNHQGLLYAKISPHNTPQTELLLAGYGYSRALLDQSLPIGEGWLNCGVLHLNYNNSEQKRNAQLAKQYPENQLYQFVTKNQAQKIAGIDLPSDALWWPYGVTVNPRSWIEALLTHPKIQVLTHTQVQSLSYHNNLWEIECRNANDSVQINSSHIVICAGAESNHLSITADFPLQIVRGQTTTALAGRYARKLNCALSGSSYITPTWRNKMCFGATFYPNRTDQDLSPIDEQINWQELSKWLPHLASDLQTNTRPQGHAALRCDAYDHLPVVGPLGNTHKMRDIYAKLKHDKNYPIETPCPWHSGAFVNTAHGSRGLGTAPICAEAIACAILGLPSPLSARLLQAMHPNRLFIRTLTHYQNY